MNVEPDPPGTPQFAEPVPQPTPFEAPRPKPWGFWMTLLFTVVILVVFTALQLAVLVGHLAVTEWPAGMPLKERLELAINDGDFLAQSVLAGAVVLPLCCVYFAWLKSGIAVRDYLALRPVSPGTLISWLLTGLSLAAGLDLGAWLAGAKVVPDVMIELYNTVTYKPLLWVAVIVGAPLSEEFLFRGFMLAGLRESWLKTFGTIVVTAAVWAVIHLQYNVAGIISIFVAGLLLGVARVRSQSLFVPIAMHAVHNLVAMLELAYVMQNNVQGPG